MRRPCSRAGSPVWGSCAGAGPAGGPPERSPPAARRCAKVPIAAVFTSMSPYESAPVAARLAAEAGVPWIADLRDPWALDEMVVYPSALHRRRAMARMGRELTSADAVVMNTAGAAAAARAAFPKLRRVTAIPNGYDPDDFAGPPPPPRRDGVLRIVHTGYLHTALGLQHRARRASWRGGEREPVDILPRSHVYLLEAIAGLPAAERASVELHLAGSLSRADEDAIRTSPAADRVRTHGYLGHAASVELVRGADLLFCPMHDLPRGGSALIVPGKTYEYLAAGRPILAAMPPGDARELVRASGTAGSAIRPTSPRCGRSSATSSRPCAAGAARCRSIRRSFTATLVRSSRPRSRGCSTRSPRHPGRSAGSRRGRRRPRPEQEVGAHERSNARRARRGLRSGRRGRNRAGRGGRRVPVVHGRQRPRALQPGRPRGAAQAETARLLASQDGGERLTDPGRRTTGGPRARDAARRDPARPAAPHGQALDRQLRRRGCSCAPASRRESPATTSTATASCSTRTASPPTEPECAQRGSLRWPTCRDRRVGAWPRRQSRHPQVHARA